MLTRQQLQQLADRNHIGLAIQERDYLQTIFLYLLYQKSQGFVFKGGTCLRVVFNSNRYSDDLDFISSFSINEVRMPLSQAAKKLLQFGIKVYQKQEYIAKKGYA